MLGNVTKSTLRTRQWASASRLRASIDREERMRKDLAGFLAQRIESEINALPKELEGLYDTFNFTRTGKNLCHPVTWGLLTKIVANLEGVAYVGIDVRLNVGGVKFQPDVVGFQEDGKAVVYVDFESPNSSDARIPRKDVKPYLAWVGDTSDSAPYVTVTALPNLPAPDWELRWTNRDQYNFKHKGKREEIRANPLRYWRGVWGEELRGYDLSSVLLLNIDRRKVTQTIL